MYSATSRPVWRWSDLGLPYEDDEVDTAIHRATASRDDFQEYTYRRAFTLDSGQSEYDQLGNTIYTTSYSRCIRTRYSQ